MIRKILATASFICIACTSLLAEASGGQKVELKVDGLHCQACVENLSKQLEALPEIEKGSVSVDLKGKLANVTFKQPTKDKAAREKLRAEINKKLAENGFEIKSLDPIQ